MDRTKSVNRSAAIPSNRDLMVGLIGAIISLAITLFQNISGAGGSSSNAILLQALGPIQQQIALLERRIRARQSRATSRTGTFLRSPHSASTSRALGRTVNVTRPGISTTFPAPPGPDSTGRSLTHPKASFVVPPGWREISNLDSYLDESEDIPFTVDSDAADETPLMSGFEYSQDLDYYPSYNINVADPESSGAFRPNIQSTLRDMNETFARDVPPNVTRNMDAAIPKRVAELRRTGQRTFQKTADGSYAVRETMNTTRPDGTFHKVTKTVSGPDISAVEHLCQHTSSTAGSGGMNVTFDS